MNINRNKDDSEDTHGNSKNAKSDDNNVNFKLLRDRFFLLPTDERKKM